MGADPYSFDSIWKDFLASLIIICGIPFVILAVPFIGNEKSIDEKAKAAGKKYNYKNIYDKSNWKEKEWQDDPRKEFDNMNKMEGEEKYEVLIPVNKVWKWVRRLFKK